ncbi:hypothetical protein C8R44DRAFT_806329 [Mycena epipterygia]|nr:hypothetical protein C8R44DRAFT_806329 [Mycena epipterygia]
MLFPLRLLLVAGLFLVLGISCHPTNSPPAKRLTPLARQTAINGLLVSRQRCESGVCPGGQCCPADSQCSDAHNGDEGCCSGGQDCSGPANECVPCSNENFCCPAGQTCSRDSNNSPTCIAGGGQPPTQTLTSTTDDSGTPTQYNQPTGTGGDGSQSQNHGLQNVTIDLSSEAGITWSGDWVSSQSSCSSSGKSRSLSGNGTSSSSGVMSYSFTGPCVYLSLSGTNTQYTISIDGEETSFVSPSTQSQSDCTIGWSRTDLASGSHNLEIKVSGVSDLRRRASIDWAFDILELVITAASSGLLGTASSNVASWPLVLFSALVCISPYV